MPVYQILAAIGQPISCGKTLMLALDGIYASHTAAAAWMTHLNELNPGLSEVREIKPHTTAEVRRRIKADKARDVELEREHKRRVKALNRL